MAAKNKAALIRIAGARFFSWTVGFLHTPTPLWKVLWFCLAGIYVGAYWLISRIDIDTETRLQRLSNVLIGFGVIQIAVVIFIAFQAAGKK